MIEKTAVVRGARVHESVYIGFFSYVNGDVQIDRNTIVGPHCSITSTVHIFDNGSFNKRMSSKKIHIKEGCWIAAGVRIMAGVTIGKGCLIGAGAVVTKDIPDYHIAVGVPAELKGKVTEGGLKWDWL